MKKGRKIMTLLYSIFLIGSIIFLGINIIINVINNHIQEEIIVDAKVVSIEEVDGENLIYVEYDVEDKKEKSVLGDYEKDIKVGDIIPVTHYTGKTKADLTIFNTIWLGFSGMFFLVGIVGIGIILKRDVEISLLKKYGEIITATYKETKKNTKILVSTSNYNLNPYNIYCTWINPTNNEMMIFKSDNLWQDPEKIIENKQIESFKVYKSRKHYYVDTSILENEK